MKVSDIVLNKINRFKSGYVFTYDDFSVSVDKVEALKKVLSRLVASGKIVRLSKGQFYKPEISEFGPLRPPEYQVVKDLLEDNRKIIGYLTGVSIYNKLGLTTQVSNTIQIGTNLERKTRNRGKYTIRFVRQKNTIYRHNIYLLQILDSIRFIKKIPDTSIDNSCMRIKYLLKNLSVDASGDIAKYAIKYNPGTRALTGALLDEISNKKITSELYASINPTSNFKIPIGEDVLVYKNKWRIV